MTPPVLVTLVIKYVSDVVSFTLMLQCNRHTAAYGATPTPVAQLRRESAVTDLHSRPSVTSEIWGAGVNIRLNFYENYWL